MSVFVGMEVSIIGRWRSTRDDNLALFRIYYEPCIHTNFEETVKQIQLLVRRVTRGKTQRGKMPIESKFRSLLAINIETKKKKMNTFLQQHNHYPPVSPTRQHVHHPRRKNGWRRTYACMCTTVCSITSGMARFAQASRSKELLWKNEFLIAFYQNKG